MAEKKKDPKDILPGWADRFARFALFFVGAAPLMVSFAVVMMLFYANVKAHATYNYYVGNVFRRYGGDLTDGYVDNSNIPKQSGGMVWVSFFHVAIAFHLIIAIAAEMTIFEFAKRGSVYVLAFFYADGLHDGPRSQAGARPGMYLAALGVYKIYICVLIFSQSFQPLDNTRWFTNDYSVRRVAIYSTYATLASTGASILARVFAYQTADQSKRPW